MLKWSVLVGVSLLTLSQSASAGGNTLIITQEGAGNVLSVDQSAASGSTVGGLVINRASETVSFQTGTKEVPGETEGDEPTIVPVYTERPVENLYASQADIALQTGIGNSAKMTITGIGGFVGLSQGPSGGTNASNFATIEALGGSSAYVGQIGSSNRATLSASDGATGTILQDGTGNIGTVTVAGQGAQGTLSQIGSGNENQLNVMTPGADVSYFVDGNGLSGLVPAEVSSNAPGPITIRQTNLGFVSVGTVTALAPGVTVTQSGQ